MSKIKNYIYHYLHLSDKIKAAIWYTICNILQKGISFIAVPLYTRILTPAEYGRYSVFLSWIDIFDILTTFRISGGGYVAGLAKFPDDRDGYSSSMQSLEIVITTISLLLYCLFSSRINQLTGMGFYQTLLVFALMYAMPAISLWTARQRFYYHYKNVVFVTLTSSFFIPVLGVIGAFQLKTHKELGIIGARVIVHGIMGFILLICNCHKKFVFFHKQYWQKTVCFNVPLLPYYFSTIILQSSDRIIINLLVNSSVAGIYGVAYSTSMIMQLFNSSIHASLQPWFFNQLKEKDYKNIPNMINTLLFFVAGANLFLIAFAPEAIRFLAPSTYYEAIWIVPPLAASVFIMFFYEHFINVEIYFENSKMIAVASIGAAIMNIILNLICIPRFGYLAAGYTTLISYFIFGITHYFFMRHICHKNNCPKNMFHLRAMLTIMALFFSFVVLLTFGYQFIVLRVISIIILITFGFFYKGKIKQTLYFIK